MKAQKAKQRIRIVAMVVFLIVSLAACAGVQTVKPGCENAVLNGNQVAMITMDAGMIGLTEYLIAKPEGKPAVHRVAAGAASMLQDDRITMADLVAAIRSGLDRHPEIQSRLSYLLMLERYGGGTGLPLNPCDREYLQSYFEAVAAMTSEG